MATALNDRAKHRLRIAAGLLRGPGSKAKDLKLSRAFFYEELQAVIAALTDGERQLLKEQTDWVEAYDNAHDSAPSTKRDAQGA